VPDAPNEDDNILAVVDGPVKVLRVSPDTITSTVDESLNFPKSKAEEFRGYKAAIRASDSEMDSYPIGEIPGVPGGEFRLSPRSREKAQFILHNDYFYVECSVWANMPPVRVDPRAQLIHEVGSEKVLEFCTALCAWLLCVEDSAVKFKPSRFDLAIDFQVEDGFKIPDRADIVSSGRDGTRHDVSGTVTGYTLGSRRSGLQIQIYNKSLEALATGKYWIFDLWAENPAFDPNKPVYRLEPRFFRKVLRDFQLNTYEDLYEALPGLVRMLFDEGPGCWYRVTEGEDRELQSNQRRCAGWFSGLLEQVRAGWPQFWRPSPAVREGKRKPRMSLARSERKLAEAFVECAAVGRATGEFSGENPVFLATRLLNYIDELNREEKTSWIGRVRDRLKKLPKQLRDQRDEWPKDGPPIAARSKVSMVMVRKSLEDRRREWSEAGLGLC
jgi:hypothetical protein